MVEYHKEEVVGHTAKELQIFPNYVEREKIARLVRDGSQVRNQEIDVRTKSGKILRALFSVDLINFDNQPHFLGSLINITDRKKAEEALIRSEERLSSVLDNTRDVIVSFNLKTGVYEFVSPSVVDLVGYSHDEFINMDAKTAFAMIHPDDVTVLQEATARSNEVGYAEAEYRQRHKNGEYIWVSNNISVQKDNSGKPVYRISNIRDITDRKKAEEELKKKAALLDISYEAIFSWDLDKGIQSWNQGAEILYGYTEKEAIGHVSHDLLKTQFPLEFKEFQEILTRNKSWAGELVHTKKDGNRIIVESRQQMIQDTSGINVIIETNRDITEKKKTEEILKESELKYRNLFDNIPLTTNLMRYVLNDKAEVVDWVFEDMNSMTQELLGQSKEELKGKSLKELMGRNHIDSFIPMVNEIRRTGKVATQESHLEAMDMYHITTFAPLNNELFLTIDQDITERKKAEIELMRSKKKISEIIESIQDNFYVLDYDWNYVYINKQSAASIGVEPQDFIGQNHWKMFPKYRGTVLEENFREAMEKREVRRFEIYSPYNDNWFIVTVYPSAEGITVLGSNITEQRKVEDYAKELLKKEQNLTEELQISNEGLQSITEELYKSNEELRKSTKLLFTIYELNPDAIVLTTVSDSKIIDCNQEYLNQIGYSREETIGHTSEELNLINKVTRRTYIDETRGNKKISNIEIKGRRKDGSFIDVAYSTRQITVDNVPMILNIGHDITESKKAEKQMEFDSLLLKKVNDAIIGTDADFKINYWNKAAEKLFGYTTDEAIGVTPFKLLNPTYEPGERRKTIEELNNKGTSKSTINIEHKNGKQMIVEQSSTRFTDSTEDTTGYVVIYHDITQLKEDEKEIINHRKVLDAINEVFREYLETDTVDEVVQKSLELAQELTESEFGFFGEVNENGRLDDRALSPPAWDVCETQNAHERLKNMEIVSYWGRTIKEEKSQIVNDPNSDPDRRGLPEGHPPINSFLGVPLKDGKNTIGMIALANKKKGYNETDEKNIETLGVAFVEVFLRKKAEINIEENLKNLAQSNKELEQFAYITSHDLREPLRMITSFLQLLERRYKDQLDQDANEFIGFAVDGAKRLDAMTNDLLQYSKITNEKREIIPVDFEHVLEHAITNLKVQIEENNAIITHDPLPTIKGDEQLKIQLFQNIIGNAIKYRKLETPKIHISATKENNQYLFSIKDNGIGMPPEHLKRIFTIFKRLHTHEEYEGTGIGLAIAQKIVHQQGGQIWAESELGKGTTFYFTIPF